MSTAPVVSEQTIGDLRTSGQRLHILCRGCGGEREYRLDRRPFDRVSDTAALSAVRARLACTQCGERQKIWLAAEYADADAAARREWGWTQEEIEAAAKTMGVN